MRAIVVFAVFSHVLKKLTEKSGFNSLNLSSLSIGGFHPIGKRTNGEHIGGIAQFIPSERRFCCPGREEGFRAC
jgi:hypothetical protein